MFGWTIGATDGNERRMSGASVGRLSKNSLRHSMVHLSSIGLGVRHATGVSGKLHDRSEQQSSAFCFLVDVARAAVSGRRMEEPEAFPLPPPESGGHRWTIRLPCRAFHLVHDFRLQRRFGKSRIAMWQSGVIRGPGRNG